MRAYHRVDPLMDERKGHYTPAQLGAFLKVQLLAGRQSRRGTFRSVAALKSMLPGPYSRHIDFLVGEGDLVVRRDKTVYVDGWDEWQEGDLTVRDRMALLKDRRKARAGDMPSRRDRRTGAERTADWRLRSQVFERDNFTCRYCGVNDYPREWLVLEHVQPAPDGPTTLENLVTACRPCNKRKGNRTPEQAGMPLLLVTRHGDQSHEPGDGSTDTSRDHASSVGVGVSSNERVNEAVEVDGARVDDPVNPSPRLVASR